MRLLLAVSGFSIVLFGSITAVKAASTDSSLSSPYITVSVAPSGAYTIASQTPGWTFGGNIGQALTNITTIAGSDNIGNYQEIDFNYTDNTGASRGGGIRTYNSKPIVMFIDNYLSATSNSSPFPHLTSYPRNLHHLTYVYAYSQPSFTKYGADSPWMFFDSKANTFILSPASDFMITSTTKATDGSISSGITSVITTLPQGFSHKTFLVIGQGINNISGIWGRAMTDLQGKIRPANDTDVTLNTLGYWTDGGSAYYYTYNPTLGYAGTLLGVKKSFSQENIPLGYMELDGWWYPKGATDQWNVHQGGIYTYTADPTLFPNGLSSFQQQLGIPLITQAKGIDPSSPYRSVFTMSNNVSTDPKYWNQIAGYLKSSGVVMYEQDFLSNQALPATNLTDPNAFMNNMASSMAANGITVQYSMDLPRHVLQSSMYNNATFIRVSGDRFNNNRWNNFLYTSQLAKALGVWPWSDTFMSSETTNLLLSTLSAGPVGVGDAIGTENATNLFKTIRADGAMVKPDVPIVPLDVIYIQDAQNLGDPMIASTYSDFGAGMKASYVFAYARGSNTGITLTPGMLGYTGNVYIYNYFSGAGTVVQTGGSFSDTVSTNGSYYIIIPIGQSGIGFLGDTGKFVSLGKKRFSQVTDAGTLQAKITFANGETSLTMYGYSPTMPIVTATNGTVGAVNYNSSTQLFTVPVSPGSDGSATITIGHS